MLYGFEALEFGRTNPHAHVQMWDPEQEEWRRVRTWEPEYSFPVDAQNVRCDPKKELWVNTYIVSRHYGGPEEGGWWYNAGECIESIMCTCSNAAQLVEEREKVHKHREWGDINSVLDGEQIQINVEDHFGRDWPEERPRFE